MAELRALLVGIEPAVLAARAGGDLEGNTIYLQFWGKPVCLASPKYTALDATTWRPLRSDEELLLLYYLTTADGALETGQWISFADLPGGRFYNQAFQGYTGHELAKAFGSDKAAFERAAASLDGRLYPLGDAAFQFHILPHVALLIVYWQGDEGDESIVFPASCQVLFDSSAGHYLPTDACAVLGSTLTRRLIAARC